MPLSSDGANHMICRTIVAAFCVALSASPIMAQRAVPTISLDKGASEFPEPFTEIRGMVELRDGRLLLLDFQEKEIRLVDYAKGTMAPAARVGQGPVEFSPTGTFLRGSSDSALYADVAQRRFLVFSPAGVPVRTIPYVGVSDPMMVLSQVQPIAIDASGLVYGQSIGIKIPAEGAASPIPTFLDSAIVQRSNIRTAQVDTIGRVRSPMAQSRPQMEMSGSSMKMVMTAPDFRGTDTWTVLPDGRVAILRDGEYRVRFVKPGSAEVLGPPVPFTAIPITAAMRSEAMDTVRNQLKVMLARQTKAMDEMRSQPGRADMQIPNFQIEVKEPASWAANLPPYTTIQSSPDGLLWVTTLKSISDAGENMDILSGSGALIAHLKLAPKEKLVGLGRGTAYTVRTDSDDLQHLRRYTLPPLR